MRGAQPGVPGMGNVSSAVLVEDATARARQAPTLADLRKALADFDGCSLKFSAKSLVFGDGNPDADVMFIGEAPGRDEDMQGRALRRSCRAALGQDAGCHRA